MIWFSNQIRAQVVMRPSRPALSVGRRREAATPPFCSQDPGLFQASDFCNYNVSVTVTSFASLAFFSLPPFRILEEGGVYLPQEIPARPPNPGYIYRST